MRIIIFTILILFFPLNCSAQITPQEQDAPTAQDAKQSADRQETPPQEADSKGDKRTDPPTQKHEADDAQGNEKFQHITTPLFQVSDWIAILLGVSAIVLSWWGLRQNRISNEKQNRAYVRVKSCELKRTKNKVKITLVLENTGHTPAHDFKGDLWVSRMESYEEPFVKTHSPQFMESIYLAPNDSKNKKIGLAFTANEMKLFLSENRFIRIYAEMTFIDHFGTKRDVRFCFKSRNSPDFPLSGQMQLDGDGFTSS